MYEGQPLQPEWFRIHTHDLDLNGDGELETRQTFNEFWIFGHKIWVGKPKTTQIPGKH